MFNKEIAACLVDHFIILSTAIIDFDYIGKSTDVDENYLNEATNLGHVLFATVSVEFEDVSFTHCIILTTFLCIQYDAIIVAIHDMEEFHSALIPTMKVNEDPLDLIRLSLESSGIIKIHSESSMEFNSDFINSRLLNFNEDSDKIHLPKPEVYEPLLGISQEMAAPNTNIH